MSETISVRTAETSDADSIADIYRFHVLNGTGTFDTEPPEVQFWQLKIADVRNRGWPFLVAELRGVIAGYAYAAQLRDRPAYAPTCEDSIYVAADHLGRGIGRELLEALIHAARESGFEQMIAVIGGGEPASIALHERCGFTHAGRLKNVGFKFGRKLDTVYMQRALAEAAS